jgi:general secretion pathway protein G
MKMKSRGFTLLELLIVMALLATIGGFLYKGIIDRGEDAKARAAVVQIASIGQALDLYKVDVGRYPTSAEGLQALMSAPSGAANWNGPYVRGAMPKDPWNNDFRYAAPGAKGAYELKSLGSDGVEGGESHAKDVVNAQ